MQKIYFCQFFLVCVFSTLSLLPIANAQSISEPYEVLLKAERVVLPENILDINFRDDILNEEVIGNVVYRLIQFYEIPNATLHQKIQDAGIELLDYIPNKAYVSSIPTNLTTQQLRQLNIRSIVKIKKDWKKSYAVRNQVFDEWAMKRNSVNLSLRYFQNINKEFIEKELNKMGARVTKSPDFIHLVQVQTTPAKVNEIVNLPFVSYVDQITDPGTPEDDLGRSLHRNNMIASDYPSGRHYTGEGVSILVRDDGDVGPHIDFHGRLNQSGNDGGTHGDGVAGVASGAGNVNPRFRGGATGATVFVRDYVADFLDGTLDLHQNEGVLLTNSSYSNGCNGGYTLITETVDMQTYENPTLCHIFSAGNSNNQDCDFGAGDQWGNITGGHKQGKNVIATANIFSDATLVNSSSRGPAHDGRIKPDISANGQNQMSTEPTNLYEPFGGTSGAAPCVMGTMAQLYQAYSELNGGDIPESALIKATILNTANDLGNEGPDFKFGWGHLNAYRAVKLLEDERYFDGMVDQGGDIQHNINIPTGTKQVRFMLYWMDEAANPMSAPALINDLNLSVQDPNSSTLLPWVLDPTPDPITLDQPAGNGMDNLNNMEQVLINDPTPGDHVLSVNGSVIPNGAVKYYIVYEMINVNDDVTVIYPNGGEGLVPNETERIYWDALGDDEDFTLEFSTDNGVAWNPIAVVVGTERIFNWTVPEFQTGQVQVRISRGNISDVSDANFSIGNVPANVEVIQACPEYIRITWDMVDGAMGYDVFSLGDKYMDSIASTSDLFYDVPITDPFGENWFAVRAFGNNGFTGRRSIAINNSSGLLDCVVEHDVSNTSMLSPTSGTIISCENLEQMVTITIQNDGLLVADSMNFYYQVNTAPPVMEPYNLPLASSTEIEFTFSTPIIINASGDYTVTTWVEYALDQTSYNNQNEANFNVVIATESLVPDVTEDFQTGIFPPENWLVFNNDGFITWEEISTVGVDNNTTTAIWINNYDYNTQFEEDEFTSVPIDLTGGGLPYISFDLAYAPFSLNFSDSLRVDIFTECGSQYHSTIYGARGLDLATVPDYEGGEWFPDNSDHWRNESFDLSEFIGETIVIKFIAVNRWGNSLFLDNINIINASQPPSASLTASVPEICVNEDVVYNNTSTGIGNTYDWDFGIDASIGAVSGDGPFTVSYSTSGSKTITLVATNQNGTNTFTQQIEVVPPPVPSFTYIIDNGVVIFTNTSTNANDYVWNFGDGNSSSDENPVYSFTTSNVFTVVLTGKSDLCEDVEYSEEINVFITGIEDNHLDFEALVLPNPNQGVFNIQISDFTNRDFEINLIDITGRVIEKQNVQSTQGDTMVKISNSALTAGIYFVKIRNEDAVKTLKVIVQ